MAWLSPWRRRVFIGLTVVWALVVIGFAVWTVQDLEAGHAVFARGQADMKCERGAWEKPNSAISPDCWQREYDKALALSGGFWGRAGELLKAPVTWLLLGGTLAVPPLMLLGAISGRRWAQILVAAIAGYVAVVVHAMVVVAIEVPVSLPLFSFDQRGDWFSAQGTWIIEGKSQAFPLQTTKIVCDRRTMECIHVQAEIIKYSGASLHVDYSRHEIQSWDDQRITYRAAALCVGYVYSVDFATKSVTGIRQPVEKPSVGFCGNIDKSDLRIRLEDGVTVAVEQSRKATPRLGRAALALLGW